MTHIGLESLVFDGSYHKRIATLFSPEDWRREDPFHTLFLFSFGAVLDVIEPQIYILIKKVEKKREPTIYSKEYIFKLDEPIFFAKRHEYRLNTCITKPGREAAQKVSQRRPLWGCCPSLN